jgi:hypothetical protein
MNDRQLKQLLKQHKQEIPDNGFSSKVMHHLPDRQPVPMLVWIFAAIGTLLFFALSNFQKIIEQGAMIVEKMPWWTLPVVSTALVCVFLVGFCFYERKTTVSLILK